jgi:hypothetical protein
MGWSLSAAAGRTLEQWTAVCAEHTGTSNTFVYKGREYFFEIDRDEYETGAVTGKVYAMRAPGCSGIGSFKIEGSGKLSRGPAALKQAMKVTQ